jgi:hypothetical protein
MEMYFDDDLMKWTTRPKRTDHSVIPSMESNVDNGENGSEGDRELYFDDDLMKWTTRPKRTEQPSTTISPVNEGEMVRLCMKHTRAIPCLLHVTSGTTFIGFVWINMRVKEPGAHAFRPRFTSGLMFASHRTVIMSRTMRL